MTQYSFPSDFLWGAATSAYQIEGGFNEDGRGLSIWDVFCRVPGKIKQGATGDVACDFYHRMEEDVWLMKQLGIRTYRFSVSWPRIIPQGCGQVNQAGLDFYHRLVDQLLAYDIEPFCTLYHWDLPQALQDEGGWNNRATAEAFAEYADVLFRSFDGKIRKWLTINEPWCVAFLGHYEGMHAPGIQDLQTAIQVSHHLLLAHGMAVKAFRARRIPGEIGIAPNMTWAEPYSQVAEDRAACCRTVASMCDWFLQPIYEGAYPPELIEWFAGQGFAPRIAEEDWELIRQPIDFVGLNYYTATVNRHNDRAGFLHSEEMDIGGYEKTDIGWRHEPNGLIESLRYLHRRYGNPAIYITENGACYNDNVHSGNGTVDDERRMAYLQQHLIAVRRALDEGIDLRGYMYWSLFDDFEWADGYGLRFGLIHVDFATLQRTPKLSYYWYRDFIQSARFETRSAYASGDRLD